jgi:hypothetical protein
LATTAEPHTTVQRALHATLHAPHNVTQGLCHNTPAAFATLHAPHDHTHGPRPLDKASATTHQRSTAVGKRHTTHRSKPHTLPCMLHCTACLIQPHRSPLPQHTSDIYNKPHMKNPPHNHNQHRWPSGPAVTSHTNICDVSCVTKGCTFPLRIRLPKTRHPKHTTAGVVGTLSNPAPQDLTKHTAPSRTTCCSPACCTCRGPLYSLYTAHSRKTLCKHYSVPQTS